VARAINPKTNLGAPYAGWACGDFDSAVFLFLLVLLLCGGDKRKQSTDIMRALEYLKDYKERAGTS